jgi:hypothetical protein
VSSAASLDAVLRAGGAGLGAVMERVERRLAELAGGHGALLAEHATAMIVAGGKRLRPLLVFLAAGEPGEAGERLLHSAVAVELIADRRPLAGTPRNAAQNPRYSVTV